MPIISPFKLKTGPPILPGFIGVERINFPSLVYPLMRPKEANGEMPMELPSTRTIEYKGISSEFPFRIGPKFFPSILRIASPVFSSVPMYSASHSVSSHNVTLISSKSAKMLLRVMMYPSSL